MGAALGESNAKQLTDHLLASQPDHALRLLIAAAPRQISSNAKGIHAGDLAVNIYNLLMQITTKKDMLYALTRATGTDLKGEKFPLIYDEPNTTLRLAQQFAYLAMQPSVGGIIAGSQAPGDGAKE
jgi:hypothetical protein